MMKKNNKKGFTLAELLIVVAIIAVLTAIAIPVFSGQLEKSREATDAANIRSAYAAVQAAALLQDDSSTFALNNTTDATYTLTGTKAGGDLVYQAVVSLKQTQSGWQTGDQDIGGVSIAAANATPNGTATITFTQATNATAISMS